MNFLYEGITIKYDEMGNGYPVLLLHGWGGSRASFAAVACHLAQSMRVFNFDLPGFGESESPQELWDTAHYAAMLEAFIKEHCEKPPVIIAHSFGGRLALHLGSKGIPLKMVLTGCAGLKPHRGIDYYAKVYSYKAAKFGLSILGKKKKEEILHKWRSRAGSSDYQNASGMMRQIFVNVVNENLRGLLKQIKAPTLLFWGKEDTATPFSDAKIMEAEIADAGLVAIEGAGHFAYLERLPQFLAVLNSFLAKQQSYRP
jgi:pimeloyl-ACP methyl ester carboxylesterase